MLKKRFVLDHRTMDITEPRLLLDIPDFPSEVVQSALLNKQDDYGKYKLLKTNCCEVSNYIADTII